MSEAVDLNLITIGDTKGQTDNDFNFVSTNPLTPEMDGIEILVSMAKQ